MRFGCCTLKFSKLTTANSCGWGTLTAFAAKNYKCDATGLTIARNQAAFGNKRIADNGVPTERARILCMDYRDIPHPPGHFTKIVSLEMAEVSATTMIMMPT